MEVSEILQLIDRINDSNLEYFEFNEGDTKITLAKAMPQNNLITVPQTEPQLPVASPVNNTQTAIQTEMDSEPVSQEEGTCVTSPMVGVAYLQAGPGQEPFVQIGDRVEVGDTLLIIEAMKLMNEIQADRSGIVTEILVDNEMIVEYGQDLVRIK